jgi:hypothetical protein
MRYPVSASVALLLFTLAAPASAQISATINIGPQTFGRGGVVVRRPAPPPPVVVVHDYHRLSWGDWRRHARDWRPVTLYVVNGRYYDRPFGNGARKVVVYRYRNQFFTAPRDRDFDRYRERYERNEWRADRRDDRRDDRRAPRGNDRSRPRQGK